MHKIYLWQGMVLAAISNAVCAQELAPSLEISIPRGYEQVYFHTIEVDGIDFHRVGYLNAETGEMIDLVLDNDQRMIDQLPRSTAPKSFFSPDADQQIAEILANTIDSTSVSNTAVLELDIGLAIPSIPWHQNEGFTGAVIFDDSSNVTQLQDGNRYT